jgi:hypothetical protein
MKLYEWLIAATGLPAASVWQAYQDSAHEPVRGTDYVTYDVTVKTPEVFLAHAYDLPEDPNDPVPEDIEKTTYGETSKTVTIRVFGPNRDANTIKIQQAGDKQAARLALYPSVFQRVVPGTDRVMHLPRESGWNNWNQFDIVIHEMDSTSEVMPTIQGSVISGTVGGEPVESEEP